MPRRSQLELDSLESKTTEQPDPAPVFACALSLWREAMQGARNGTRVNLSECYNGGDEFMRVLMRVATRFETWACEHVDFAALDEVWPYLLEERFGPVCCAVLGGVQTLGEFDDDVCLHVALRLRLPVKIDCGLPVPLDVSATNPVPDSEFRSFRIVTMRERGEHGECVPFTNDDAPYAEEFSAPFFALYGVGYDGLREHIADRVTYEAAVNLARKLAPGVEWPAFSPRPNAAR